MKMEQTRVFRNVGIQNSDTGELPRRKYTSVRLTEVWNNVLRGIIEDQKCILAEYIVRMWKMINVYVILKINGF